MKRKISALVSLIMLVLLVAAPLVQALELDTAISDEYEIQGDKVIPKIGSVFSDLNVWGTALLRVFTDNTKTKTLSAEDKLVDGSVIELEEDGAFAYFTVYSPIQELLFAPQNASEYGSVARGEASDVSGAFGKDESDSCVYLNSIKADGSASKFSCYKDVVVGTVSDDVWSYSGTEGYIIIEASIVTKTGTAFQMLTNSNFIFLTYSTTVALNANVWNKVYLVYDFETQKAKRIINGEESDWIDSNFGKNNKTALRLYFEGEANNTGAYIDDLTIYTSKRMPEYIAPPALDETVYNISGSRLISDGTVKAGDVVSSGVKIKVFSDQTYAESLDNDAVLENGNVILLEKDGLYNIYSVTVSNGSQNRITWHMDESIVNAGSNSYPVSLSSSAVAEKDSGYAYYFKTGTWFGLTTSFKADMTKALIPPQDDMTSYEGYMILSMNVYSPNAQQFRIRSTSVYITNNINITAANGFDTARWNKVLVAIPLSATESVRVSDVYVNGVKKEEFSCSHGLFTSGNNEVRIVTNTSGKEMYVKDVYVDFIEGVLADDEIVEMARLPRLNEISGKLVISGGIITLSAETALGELTAEDGTEITAYTSSDFGTKLTAESKLESGNVVVVTDSRGNVQYYDVQ